MKGIEAPLIATLVAGLIGFGMLGTNVLAGTWLAAAIVKGRRSEP